MRICDNTTASVKDPSSARDGAEIGVFHQSLGHKYSATPLNNTSSLLYSSRWLQALGGTDRVPPGLSEGGSHGGARSNKLNLSSSLYTLAADSSTLHSVLAAFSPLRRQDLGFPTLLFTAR